MYIALFFLPCAAAAQEDADLLYRNRTVLTDAQRAAAIWEQQVSAAPRAFDSWWKLARAMYWLGGHETTEDARRKALERGVEAGRQAADAEPMRPEGHFWMAANMGALAESFGLRQGLRYRGAIREALQRVLAIDPGFQRGSADRALGRWYHKVPRLFGGNNRKSEELLRTSLTYDPDSTASLFFLAETLLALDRDEEAIEALKKVVAAPVDPDWAPEDREFKQKAADRLQRMRR